MTKDTDRPAFPTAYSGTGMNMRDYFASKAMSLAMNRLRQSYTQDLDNDWHWDKDDWDAIAELSYQMADAMLKARCEE